MRSALIGGCSFDVGLGEPTGARVAVPLPPVTSRFRVATGCVSAATMPGVKQRVTLSVDPAVAAYLQRRSGGNVSAFVEAHFTGEALRESVASHAEWFSARPGWLDDAEAERLSA